MSRIQRLANALLNGEELTAKQISARFGLANPRAAIYKLRAHKGLPVYCNSRENWAGNKYRLGTVSRRVLAAGYRALASGKESSRPAGRLGF
jgi:hypothetical protein